jgi:hypothetical protein
LLHHHGMTFSEHATEGKLVEPQISRKPHPNERSAARYRPKSTSRLGLSKLTPRWLQLLLSYAWFAEITSLLLASIALAAIVITLAIHQGRPIPQWSQLISINSLIAIFTAVLKTATIMPVAEG